MPAMSETTPRPKRRLWRRLLRWLFVLGILFMLLAIGGAWWANENRLALTNRALASLEGPVTGAVEGIELTRSGKFEVVEFTLKDKATGATVVRLPKLTGSLAWSALSSRSVTGLTFHEPEISLDETALASWMQSAAGTKKGSGGGSSSAFRLENLDIRNAKLRFTHKDKTVTEILLNYKSSFVALSREGLLSLGDEELTITEASAKGDIPSVAYGLHRLHVKGSMHDGILDLEEFSVDRPTFLLTPGLLATLGVSSSPAGEAGKNAAPSASPTSPAAPSMLRGVRIGKFRVSDFSAATSGFKAGNATGLSLPDTKVVVPMYEAEGIEWSPGEPPSIGRQKLRWEGLQLDAPEGGGHLRFEDLEVTLGPWTPGEKLTVESLYLRNPDVHWTPALRQMLMQKGPATQPLAAPPAPAPPPANVSPQPPISLVAANIAGAKVRIADPELMAFELDLRGGVMASELVLDGKGWSSPKFQTLEVLEGNLTFPPDKPGAAANKPWLELASGELAIKPDDWNASRRTAKLNLEKLVVRMRDGNTPWIAASPTPAESAPVPQPEPAVPTNEVPLWKRINFGQLSLKEGRVDMLLNAPKPVDMQARIDISTQRVEEVASQHTVKVSDFSAKLPTLSSMPFPVVQAKTLEGRVLVPEVWQTHRFEELRLSGASVDLGEALLKLFETEQPAAPVAEKGPPTPKTDALVQAGPPAPAEPMVAPPKKARDPKTWHVGHLSVDQSDITVTNLVPGMPAVKFGVSFDVKDSPLLAEDLVDNVSPQRIELHDLKIPSPNGTARYVAELDSIFVDFTLEGLMRKEIGGIEIVSPTLFVGEDLFWYVDFYRKYAERGAHPAKPGPQVAAANAPDLEQGLAAAVKDAEPPTSQASWSVKRLQVHSGKLVLAPKGVPLKGFRTPFPFHIDTEVTRGTLNADLDIPPDTYELPDLDLQFVGMKGHVQFNLPLKQKDNNLVETFEVDSIRWKGVKTGKAFLSVTYDTAGIYSKFGAEAYEGYINGEFNLYTDDSFHWDGWMGGKNVQTHDLTRVLCPGYFVMKGRVEATLVAQGSRDELYQADATFKNHTPGKFTISGLNGLINDLPKEWDQLSSQITKIGLETLRDFEYDHAEMKCRFYGREGNGTLSFTGPLGSRKFEINVYDHRWKTDDPVVIFE